MVIMNTYIQEGKSYLQTAKSFHISRRFDLSVVQDLVAMSGEKIIVGILAFHDYMPEGHTYTELIKDLEKRISLSSADKKSLLNLDKQQNLCSLDPIATPAPNEQVVRDAIQAIERMLEQFFSAHSSDETTP